MLGVGAEEKVEGWRFWFRNAFVLISLGTVLEDCTRSFPEDCTRTPRRKAWVFFEKMKLEPLTEGQGRLL